MEKMLDACVAQRIEQSTGNRTSVSLSIGAVRWASAFFYLAFLALGAICQDFLLGTAIRQAAHLIVPGR